MSIELGTYQHYKGSRYVVTGVATHHDSNTKHVIFHNEGDPYSLWTRPVEEFSGLAQQFNGLVKRFVKVPDY